MQFFGENPAAVDSRMTALKQWIKDNNVRDLEAVPLFAEQLSRETVQMVEGFTERLAKARATPESAAGVKRMVIKGIPRVALLKPSHAPFRLRGQKFALGDRVVVAQDSGNVPLAARGVVVGVNTSHIDVVFDVPFLSGSTLSGRCSPYRGASVAFHAILNLTNPQFVADKGAANGAQVSRDALERTMNGLSLSGPSNGNGAYGNRAGSAAHHSNGRGGGPGGVHQSNARGGGAGGVMRPPSTFKPAPGAAAAANVPRGGGAGGGRGGRGGVPHGPVQLLQRKGPPRAQVSPNAPFAGVAAGKHRPTTDQARAKANVNPHLAALNAGLAQGTSSHKG